MAERIKLNCSILGRDMSAFRVDVVLSENTIVYDLMSAIKTEVFCVDPKDLVLWKVSSGYPCQYIRHYCVTAVCSSRILFRVAILTIKLGKIVDGEMIPGAVRLAPQGVVLLFHWIQTSHRQC